MYKLIKPLFIKCITPLHAGSGQDLGIVDMPIQREKHTGFPKIEGSSLKGSIRESFEMRVNNDEDEDKMKKIQVVFGYDEDSLNIMNSPDNIKKIFEKEKGKFAGAIGFTDARILLFPVKSMKGVFAYVTCPSVLNKFQNEMNMCGETFKFDIQELKQGEAYTCKESEILVGEKKDKVILEEYTFTVTDKCEDLKDVCKLGKFINDDNLFKKIVVISNDDFSDFVNMSTEVITRTKIDSMTGTVKDGALFTEEYLPAESVMYSLAMFSPLFFKLELLSLKENEIKLNSEFEVCKYFKENLTNNKIIQIGGNATIGKGITELTMENCTEVKK